MNDSDKKAFAQQMMIAAEIFDKPVSKEKLQIYFAALKQYPIEAVVHGLQQHLVDPAHGDFFPKPADIVRHINGVQASAEDKAELAWMQVESAIRSVGSYGNLDLEDKQALAAVKSLGSWKDLCMTDSDKMQWKRKQFIEAYMTFENTPTELLPHNLPGIADMHNQRLDASKGLQSIYDGLEDFRKRKGLDN